MFRYFFYPSGKPVASHLLRYQGFDVKKYYFTPDALKLERHRLLERWRKVIVGFKLRAMFDNIRNFMNL